MFTIASWNVNGRKSATNHCQFIGKSHPHLLALQEVTPSFFHSIMGSSIFEWGIHSLMLRPSLAVDGKRRGLGTALLGRAPFFFTEASLLPSVATPERALVADVESPIGVIKACAFHVPPGSTWGGSMKSQTFRGISAWLRDQSVPVLVGMDANTPKLDHPAHLLNEWWRKDEDLLLGARATHGLSDTLRTYLSANDDILKCIIAERPHGPLAVSFIRKGHGKASPCRYDFVLASHHFHIKKVTYPYAESLNAGSDHSMVIAEIEL